MPIFFYMSLTSPDCTHSSQQERTERYSPGETSINAMDQFIAGPLLGQVRRMLEASLEADLQPVEVRLRTRAIEGVRNILSETARLWIERGSSTGRFTSLQRAVASTSTDGGHPTMRAETTTIARRVPQVSEFNTTLHEEPQELSQMPSDAAFPEEFMLDAWIPPQFVLAGSTPQIGEESAEPSVHGTDSGYGTQRSHGSSFLTLEDSSQSFSARTGELSDHLEDRNPRTLPRHADLGQSSVEQHGNKRRRRLP